MRFPSIPILIGTAFALCADASAVPVDLVNPGFEATPRSTSGGFDVSGSDTPGWRDTATPNAQSGVVATTGFPAPAGGPALGTAAARIEQASNGAYQVTGHAIAGNTRFTLTWQAGRSAGNGGSASVSLFRTTDDGATRTIIATLSSPFATGDTANLLKNFTLSYTATGADAGSKLGIQFDYTGSSANRYATFDNFALEVEDVPLSNELFAGYFDIKTGSPQGTEVIGKVNLERNKDAHVTPVPADYSLAITSDPSGLFELVNQRDSENRLFGMLRVKPGRTVSATPADYPVTVVLAHGPDVLTSRTITIRAVTTTIYETLMSSASNHALAADRLFGRTRPNDATVDAQIAELETNSGRFTGFDFYTRPISDYVNTADTSIDLSTQWQTVAAKIGGLGYAYLKSTKYGPAGLPANCLRLKNALYASLAAYMDRIQIDPVEVIINGQPSGAELGDGVMRLYQKGIVSYNDATHQWIWTDPVTGPVVWLMPDLLTDIRNGDTTAIALHEKFVRFFQISFGLAPDGERPINDPNARWGRLTDTLHTEGAHSDGNITHRMRGWMELPAIWADYNRPLTYVPYWYDGFYDAQFPGFQMRPGWSPHGVLDDYYFWVKNAFTQSHLYPQSGFHPDGTITHHLSGGANGVAMFSYGYEWMVEPIPSYAMFKNLPFDLGSGGYNHIADHYLYTYDKIAYKGDFDLTSVGRAYYADLKKFVSSFPATIDDLIASKQPTTQITNEQALIDWKNAIKNGTHQVSGNFPFWVTNIMIHRQGGQKTDNTNSWWFGVKMDSDVSSAPDDFDSVVKSYHVGSGVLQTKLTGSEYDLDVRQRFDWHALPGITEEWRTDAMPSGDGKQTNGSAFAGMASDGTVGFAAMRYRQGAGETYAVAQADKGYFFSGDSAIALGCNVARSAAGQNKPIITTIDQTRWVGDLTYSINQTAPVTVAQGSSIDQTLALSGPTWAHQGRTGYLIFPQGAQPLYVRGGAAVVDADTRDTSTASVIHLALGHGIDPVVAGLTGYRYIIVPNIDVTDMPQKLAQMQTQIEVIANGNNVQGIHDHGSDVIQLAFHAAGTVTTTAGYQIGVDSPALVQFRRNGNQWELSATDPIHELNATAIHITTNIPLLAGSYAHTLPGIKPRSGEPVTVTQAPAGVLVNVPLPDPTDDAALGYQAALYANVPIHVALVLEDADGNGLRDEWETRFFGSTGQNPDGNPDQDGLSNLEEQTLGTRPTSADSDGDGTKDGPESRLGTDPLDPAQRFAATLSPIASGWEIRWPGRPGCNFKIERCDRLDNWITLEEAWPSGENGGRYSDHPPSGATRVFYRVSLQPR